VFLNNDAKFDNIVDAIKIIPLNYSNYSIAKIVVKKIERVKSTRLTGVGSPRVGFKIAKLNSAHFLVSQKSSNMA